MPEPEAQLSNPFPYPAKGLPFKNVDYFVDRPHVSAAIETSLQALLHGRFHGIRFVGQRGCGKTCILDYLNEVRCSQLNVLPVPINVVDAGVSGYRVVDYMLDSVKQVAISRYGLYPLRRHWWNAKRLFKGFTTPIGGFEVQDRGPRVPEIIQKEREAFNYQYRKLKRAAGIEGVLIMLDDADKLDIGTLGRIGMLFNEMRGYTLYLATGSEPPLQLHRNNGNAGVPAISDIATGVLAYWECVEVGKLSEAQVKEMVQRCPQGRPGWAIPERDMEILVSLCDGNGRLAMILAHMSYRVGLEQAGDQVFLHITEEVLRAAIGADPRLGEKLRITEQFLRARDPGALRPRWW